MNNTIRTYHDFYNYDNSLFDVEFRTVMGGKMEWEEIIILDNKITTNNNTEHIITVNDKIDIPRLPSYKIQPHDCTADKIAYGKFINGSRIHMFRMKEPTTLSEIESLRIELIENNKNVLWLSPENEINRYVYSPLTLSGSPGLTSNSYRGSVYYLNN